MKRLLVILTFLIALSSAAAHAAVMCGEKDAQGNVIAVSQCGTAADINGQNGNLCPLGVSDCSLNQYRCQTSDQIFADQAACDAQCVQNASCPANPYSATKSNTLYGGWHQVNGQWVNTVGGWAGCMDSDLYMRIEYGTLPDGRPSFRLQVLDTAPGGLQHWNCEWDLPPNTWHTLEEVIFDIPALAWDPVQISESDVSVPSFSCAAGCWTVPGYHSFINNYPNQRPLGAGTATAAPSSAQLMGWDGNDTCTQDVTACGTATPLKIPRTDFYHLSDVQFCLTLWGMYSTTETNPIGKYCLNEVNTTFGIPYGDGDPGAHTYDYKVTYSISIKTNSYTCPLNPAVACTGTPGNMACSIPKACKWEPVCPLGYGCDCSAGVTPSCPSNGTFTGGTVDKCRLTLASLCPANYTPDPAADGCVKTPDCTNGAINAAGTMCEATVDITCSDPLYSYSITSQQCGYTMLCPAATPTWDQTLTKCRSNAQVCPAGDFYTSGLDVCSESSTGPPNTVLNATSDKYEATVSWQCPTGYIYNTTTGQCETAPPCGTGYTYSTANNRCEKAATSSITYTCPNGGTLSGTTCSYTATSNTTYSCPSGGTLSGTTCSYTATGTTNYTCPSGGTLSGTTCYTTSTYTATASTSDCWIWGSSCFSRPYGDYGLMLGCFNNTVPAGASYIDQKCHSIERWKRHYRSTTYSCPSGGTLSGTTCTVSGSYAATANITYSCPSGGTLSGTTCSYAATASTTYTCPNGGTRSGTTCSYAATGTTTYSCSTGTLSGTICWQSVTCASSGTLNTTSDKCQLAATAVCPSQTTYNATAGKCQAAPSCVTGYFYVNGRDRCEKASNGSCAATYDQATGYCTNSLTCPSNGKQDPNNGLLCSLDPTVPCPDGMAPGPVNGSTVTCQQDPTCTQGSLAAALGKCLVKGQNLCPTNYAYDKVGDNCETNPICSNSTFDPAQDKCCACASTNSCLSSNGGTSYQCSPNPCVDLTANPPVGQTADMTSFHNDGAVTPSGQCTGQMYIFNGKPEKCREAGNQTQWNNCCNPASAWIQTCDPQTDLVTNADRNAGLCHKVDDQGGVYCVDSWPIVGCVQQAEVYCCFASKMARVIQEQGRKQLTSFGGINGWGYVLFPNCRGFTPEEFQKLDLTKIDFSEVIADMQNQVQSLIPQLQNNATNAIQQYYNQIQ